MEHEFSPRQWKAIRCLFLHVFPSAKFISSYEYSGTGSSVGFLVGVAVGLAVGTLVGDEVTSATLGAVVGADVGDAVTSATLGAVVGADETLKVGDTVASTTGAIVGTDETLVVGDAVTSATVGADESPAVVGAMLGLPVAGVGLGVASEAGHQAPLQARQFALLCAHQFVSW